MGIRKTHLSALLGDWDTGARGQGLGGGSVANDKNSLLLTSGSRARASSILNIQEWMWMHLKHCLV